MAARTDSTAPRAYHTTVLTADCPWPWRDKLPGAGRGAAAHLPEQTIEQLYSTPLPRLAENAVLFLWRPASRLGDALAVMSAWGFTPKTEVVWLKRTAQGNRAFGMGRIVRGEHETCLVGTRGKPTVATHSARSVIEGYAPPYEKPTEFYALVQELYPQAVWYDRTARGWLEGWQRLALAQGAIVRQPSPAAQLAAR